jgi:hypothetical protein
MKHLWWKFPNQGFVPEVFRWSLAIGGVVTIGWAFTSPGAHSGVAAGPSLDQEQEPTVAQVPPEQRADLSRWMQRTAEESPGSVLEAALGHVGPWARNQTSADNDVPAKVPSATKAPDK